MATREQAIVLDSDSVVGEARRKAVKNLLRSWVVGEEPHADLLALKKIFDSGEWDAMLLKYVVPKLGTTLRNEFRINPRDQKMEPLEQVLQWADIIRPSIYSQILETEFFPKWLDALHIWLIQPRVSFEEVAVVLVLEGHVPAKSAKYGRCQPWIYAWPTVNEPRYRARA